MEPTGTNGRTRHTLSDPLGSGLVLWWFSRWMAGNAVSCGHETKDRSVLFASVVRFPDRHDRNRGRFRCRPPVFPVGRYVGFAVVMAQVRRPVPFRTRKLRPGCGDGTALERVWESSAPPHSFVGGSSGRVPHGIPGRSFFVVLCWPAGRSPLPGVPVGPFPLLGVRIIPRTGRLRTPRDFRNFRGASCAYPMVE